MLDHRDNDEQLREFAQNGAAIDADLLAEAPFRGVARASWEMRGKISELEDRGSSIYIEKLYEKMQDPRFAGEFAKKITTGEGILYLPDPELKKLGIVLNAFADQFASRDKYQLRVDREEIGTLQRNSEKKIALLTKRQKELEAQAKAIAAAQAAADKRNKEQLEAIRQERLKVGNERFERWINNFKWTLYVFYDQSSFVVWLILITFALSSVPYYFTARFSISDRCLSQGWCRSVAIKLWQK